MSFCRLEMVSIEIENLYEFRGVFRMKIYLLTKKRKYLDFCVLSY